MNDMRLSDEIVLSFGLSQELAEKLEKVAFDFQCLGMGSAAHFMAGLRSAFEDNGYTLSELIKISTKDFDHVFRSKKVKRQSSGKRTNHVGETFPGRSICKRL